MTAASNLDASDAIAAAEDALGRPPSDVIPVTTHGGYMVRSRSQPDMWRLVKINHGASTAPERIECDCPAGVRIAEGYTDKPCRHMQRVLAYTKAENDRLRRPAAPPAANALCD